MKGTKTSLHVYVDGCENADLERLYKHVRLVRPGAINVTAASRFNESISIIDRITREAPECMVIWRGWAHADWKDDGLWQRKTPDEWLRYRVTPYLDFIRSHNVAIMTDNEAAPSTRDEAERYSAWMSDAARLSFNLGVRAVVGRFPTWNPKRELYDAFDRMYHATEAFNAVLSPNEYSHINFDKDAEQTGRFLSMIDRYIALGLKLPDVVIGEWNLATDAHHGYKTLGMGGTGLARLLHGLVNSYYNDAVVCTFSFGRWARGNGTFDVHDDEDYLQEIERIAQSGEVTIVTPDEELQFEWVTLGLSPTNIRDEPYSGGILRTAQVGERLQLATNSAYVDVKGGTWYTVIDAEGITGWMKNWAGDLNALFIPIDDEVPTPPDVDGNPYLKDNILRSLRTMEVIAAEMSILMSDFADAASTMHANLAEEWGFEVEDLDEQL